MLEKKDLSRVMMMVFPECNVTHHDVCYWALNLTHGALTLIYV